MREILFQQLVDLDVASVMLSDGSGLGLVLSQSYAHVWLSSLVLPLQASSSSLWSLQAQHRIPAPGAGTLHVVVTLLADLEGGRENAGNSSQWQSLL